jgi:hypothetical protein
MPTTLTGLRTGLPGSVPFRAELPDELEALQARIAESLRALERSCRERDFERLAGQLAAFDRTLHQYLIDEGLQFEPYLRCALEQDHETLLLMNRLRSRLRELAREVHDVAELALHANGARTLRVVDEVIARVGRELAQCFEHQRTLLFPRYRPFAARASG